MLVYALLVSDDHSATASDLNKCLYTCAPITELPSDISTRQCTSRLMASLMKVRKEKIDAKEWDYYAVAIK